MRACAFFVWIMTTGSAVCLANSTSCTGSAANASNLQSLPTAIAGTAYSTPVGSYLTNPSSKAMFSCTSKASWLEIDPSTGDLLGLPNASDASSTAVPVDIVVDGDMKTTIHLSITVNPATPVELIGRIIEGTTTITGTGGAAGAAEEILDLDAKGPLLLQGGSLTVTASQAGSFTAVLAVPLYSGERIQVMQQAKSGGAFTPVSGEITISDFANWGRVRANFAAGAVLSYNNSFELTSTASGGNSSGGTGSGATPSGNTSQSTLFLAFDIDKNWRWIGVESSGSSAPTTPSGSLPSGTVLPPAVQNKDYDQSPMAAPKGVKFRKVEGPGWLTVETNGHIKGKPLNIDALPQKLVIEVRDGKASLRYTYWITVTPDQNLSQISYKADGNSAPSASSTSTPPNTASASPVQAPAQPSFRIAQRYGFDTFIQARLTSVPITICPQATGSTTPQTGSGGQAASAVAAAATGTGTTSGSGNSTGCASGSSGTDTLSTFLSSAKSAEVQGGAYLPILTKPWTFQNAPNALFIAPLARVGFVTPTGSTTQSSGAGVTTQAVNPAQFYNFYGFGGRIGHYKLSADQNSAPELLSYIDVTWGRYSNLETLAQGPDGLNITERRWRIGVEALLKIPTTPFVLGMNANIGQNLLGAPTIQGAKDDLRFFVGAKFDVGKVLSKIPAL